MWVRVIPVLYVLSEVEVFAVRQKSDSADPPSQFGVAKKKETDNILSGDSVGYLVKLREFCKAVKYIGASNKFSGWVFDGSKLD
jgi:hypothetical protein